MIVVAAIARKLVQGRASQVRLPVGAPQRLLDGRTVPARCPYTVGESYAVQRHYVEAYTIEGDDREYEVRSVVPSSERERVIVTAVRRTTLGDLTYEDIRREGFATREEYLETWTMHRGSSDPDRAVWVLAVEADADPVRLLTPTGRPTGHMDDHGEWQGSELDYTSNPSRALRNEPPAVDAATLDEFAKAARERHQARRSETDSERVERLLAEARDLLGPAGRDDVRVIERRLQSGLNKRRAA